MPTDPYTGTAIGPTATVVRCPHGHENLIESWVAAGNDCSYPGCAYAASLALVDENAEGYIELTDYGNPASGYSPQANAEWEDEEDEGDDYEPMFADEVEVEVAARAVFITTLVWSALIAFIASIVALFSIHNSNLLIIALVLIWVIAVSISLIAGAVQRGNGLLALADQEEQGMLEENEEPLALEELPMPHRRRQRQRASSQSEQGTRRLARCQLTHTLALR